MKYLFIACLLIVSFSGFAQLNHFIYIQTENKQPFYVVMDKKVLSSTVSGYIIIPKLRDSVYKLTIGFPKNEWPEQKVTCTISKTDAGYLLKNFGNTGWGLFNLQTLSLVVADTAVSMAIKENKKDGFAEKLAEVVNDPSLKNSEKISVKINADTVAKKNNADTLLLKKEINQEIKNNVATPVVKDKSVITRLSNIATNESVTSRYVDNTDGKSDTITVEIPVSINSIAIKKEIIKADNSQIKADTIKKEIKSVEITPIENKIKTDSEIALEKPVSNNKTKDTAVAIINSSNCKEEATDNDFIILRKKMSKAKSDNEMLDIANKVFAKKCFSTNQIDQLGQLFTGDDAKYKLFDDAYQHVIDWENYSRLAAQLKDSYYIKRFNAMLR